MVVHPVSRLSNDTYALTVLRKYQTPTIIPMLPKDIAMDLYGFVDSSGSGYGISLPFPSKIMYLIHNVLCEYGKVFGEATCKNPHQTIENF